MNSDFKDLFRTLSEEGVDFLLVGAHAVMLYSEPRFTKDLDIWVGTSAKNSRRVYRALARFGAPLDGIAPDTFVETRLIYQIGVPPNRIDVITSTDGVEFVEAWSRRHPLPYMGESVPVISKQDLIVNKRASGRPQDLLDLSRLLED